MWKVARNADKIFQIDVGGHIHIGSDYLTTGESWENLKQIWGNMESLLYIICNKGGDVPREGSVTQYAQPISRQWEEISNDGSVQIQDEEDLKEYLKKIQGDTRYYGLNLCNIGNQKNTIEFRLANGTIEAETWIENINLFGGIVRASEDLAQISLKQKAAIELTEEEKTMLENFEKIKTTEISDKLVQAYEKRENGTELTEYEKGIIAEAEREKLEALLSIVIPNETDRTIYMERYEVNSQILELEEYKEVKEGIIRGVAKSPISINKLGKKVFLGEDGITGLDYDQFLQELEKNIQKEEQEQSMR